MRQIGTLASRAHAQRLAAHLFNRGIRSQIDAEAPPGTAWALWVYDEDQVPAARDEFARFVQNPDAPEFVEAEATAAKAIDEHVRQKRATQVVDLRERWQRPPVASQFVTMLLIAVSIVVFLLTNFGDEKERQSPLMQTMFIASFREVGNSIVWRGLAEIRTGQVWRLVTPIFLHFGLFHILFNLMWLYDLGMVIEFRRGPLRFAGLVLVVAIISNLSQYWWKVSDPESAPMLFGGMSGVVYGLLGYAWMKSRFHPAAGIFLSRNVVLYAVIWLVLCMLPGVLQIPIANAAHVSGFAVGIALGLLRFT